VLCPLQYAPLEGPSDPTAGKIDVVDSLRGQLLIAGPSLWDPNFRRTVVLIGHHDEEGAVGVVLNRPLDATVEETVPPLSAIVPPGESLFVGGPVQPGSAVVLADFEDPERAGVIALDSIGFLPEETGPDGIEGLRRARVFAGYAGWGAGQLEAEMEEASWHVTPAFPGDVFTDDPIGLWGTVVERLGPAFRLLRTMPMDPQLN
jgi:putative transcriptional regulator